MKTIHKVCSMIRKHEAVNIRGQKKAQEHARCKECPAWIETGHYGKGKQMCRGLAEEMMNVIKWGNPWGRKYRHSRKSWPDRAGYTDKHSRASRSASSARTSL